MVTGSSNNGTNDDFYTAKYAAANGALLWERRYNNSSNGNDTVSGLALDSAGNVVIIGSSLIGENQNGYLYESYTAKYAAANGALLWGKPRRETRFLKAVATDVSGNVVVAGYAGRYPNTAYYTAKYATTNGALVWEIEYDSSGYDAVSAVVVNRSGDTIVTGFSGTIKYFGWQQSYASEFSGDPHGSVIALDTNNNVVIAGNTWNGTNIDYYVAKYAASDGTRLWEQLLNGPSNGHDYVRSVAVDKRGDVVVTGYSGTEFNHDYYTVKCAGTNGAVLWERLYNGTGNSLDEANAVALDQFGNAVVTGRSRHN